MDNTVTHHKKYTSLMKDINRILDEFRNLRSDRFVEDLLHVDITQGRFHWFPPRERVTHYAAILLACLKVGKCTAIIAGVKSWSLL